MSDAVMVPRAEMKFAIAQAIWEIDRNESTAARTLMVAAQRLLTAASTPVGGLGSLADADTHRATEEAVVVPETTVRSYSMPRSGPTGSSVADAVILGFLHGVGRQPWDDMHDYIAVCALDYAFGKPGAREHLSAPPPPSVSTGSRPQEAVPTCDAEAAVVGPGGWLIKDFADGWFWTGQRIAAVAALTEGHSVFDIMRGEYASTPQPADGCSSNEGEA